MYKQVQTNKQILWGIGKYATNPVATLKDEYGGICQIIIDDHCYLVCLKQKDGSFMPTRYIFPEAFEVLKTLPAPDQQLCCLLQGKA